MKTAADDNEELLEVLDEQGEVVGLRRRGAIHGDPTLAHRAVHVFVRNKAGELFLQKRSQHKTVQPGKWDVSVGGHVDPGETWEIAAVRELEEELGVRFAALGVTLQHLHDYIWRSSIETEHIRTFCIAYEGPFVLHPYELEDGRFWTGDQLQAAMDTGDLSENLEEELRRLGVVSPTGS